MDMWKLFRKSLIVLVAAALIGPAALTGPALATEGGGGSYPNGAEDFMTGALPPPGTYYKNYLIYYRASRFNDKDGNVLIPDFQLTAAAEALRFIHVTKYKILGASWGVQAFIPLAYQAVTIGGQEDARFSLGDIIIDPIILGWHFKNFHVTAGLDIYLPVGTYNQNHQANNGRNYWTFEPALAMTYLSDGGIEVSAQLMSDINTENNDTNYKSGQEFHMDYTIGYHLNKQWAVGVNGYYYYQVTDDEQNGSKVGDDGFKGRVFAIGPVVQYGYKNMNFTLKWQPEFEARNRPEGNKFYFNFLYIF